MTNSYFNGLGEALGSVLSTCKPLVGSGDIWYVNSVTGVDAVSPRGKNRERPLATLAQAVTNAADYDIICLMDGHTESFTALSLTKSVTIVGGGRSSGKPTVKLTPSASGTFMDLSAAFAVRLVNVWIKESAVANSSARIAVGSNFEMRDCYVECGANDNAAGLQVTLGSTFVHIKDSTFISTATLVTAQPTTAIRTVGTAPGLTLDGVTVSAGAVGFSNPYAVDLSTGIVLQARIENLSLLLGADLKMNASSTGYINVQTCTGGSRVDW